MAEDKTQELVERLIAQHQERGTDLPNLTCPQIDRAIEELEKVRNDNSQLRYSSWFIIMERDSFKAESDALREANERLREALEPFGRFEEHSRRSYRIHDDEHDFYSFNDVSITVGDLRRARAALTSKTGE